MEQSDFLVIGSGLAGLTFALRAAEHGTVTVLTKARMVDSNTSWAQGGIAAAVGESDNWQMHEEDTLVAGAGLCDPAAVRALVQNAPAAIEWLIQLGADFDRDASGELDLAREGGHGLHRIVHHADRTGWEIERTVVAAVRKDPRIRVYEDAFVTRLWVHEGRCVGALATINDLGERTFAARATLLATGGAGKLYATTTNPRVATADGIALAASEGVEVRDMEFMQFHPTTLVHAQSPGFLLTEALRGHGATLKNHRGTRFMYDYDERLELAPRDIVARAIAREMQGLDTWCVYLDATHLPADELKTDFPTIWERLRGLSLRMERDWIPVAPGQHYSCGGVVTNLAGQTGLPGLYASGEVARTGVHGANRLASNSLLEAIVFSTAAAEAAPAEPAIPKAVPAPAAPKCIAEHEAIRIRHALQRLMSAEVGVFRTDAGLSGALAKVKAWREEYQSLPAAGFSPYSRECEHLLVTAELVVGQALARRENVGLHFNADLA